MARLMPRLPIREESQRHLTEGDRKWKPKAALRIISTFLAFLAMILFAVSTGMTVRWENVWDNGIGNDWTDGMPLAPVCDCQRWRRIEAPVSRSQEQYPANSSTPSGSPCPSVQPHCALPTHPLPPRQGLPPRLRRRHRPNHLGALSPKHRLLRRRWLVLVVAARGARI